jgi:hypothetical protein
LLLQAEADGIPPRWTHEDGKLSLKRRHDLERQLTQVMNQQQRLIDMRLEEETASSSTESLSAK